VEPVIGWHGQAVCAGVPLFVFFDKQGSDPGAFTNLETEAQRWLAANRFCYGCPVMKKCLEANVRSEYGTFGGLDQGARYVLRQLRKGVVKARRMAFLHRACWEMEQAGYDHGEIAAHLEISEASVGRYVSAWCKSEKGKKAAKEAKAWRMLMAGRPMVEVAKATRLEYPHVVIMRKALEAAERGPEEKVCKVTKLPATSPSTETAGPATTAA